LLEKTKNERLKFLLSKTDDHIIQVLAILLEQRAQEIGYDTAMDHRSSVGSRKEGTSSSAKHFGGWRLEGVSTFRFTVTCVLVQQSVEWHFSR